jgi:lipopolysaccharide/colanic/teichoic acid biosynthesis glycosyltransferase
MKPGLTCIWHVSGRSKISSFDEWLNMDLEYIDNWSLWLDIKLILKTIPIVFLGIGAR